MSRSDWTVGAEVVECHANWGRATYGAPNKIAKVYATGNFILEGDENKQQWQLVGDRAVRTSSGRFSSTRSSLVLWNDENKAIALAANKAAKASKFLRDMAEEIDKLARNHDDDAIVAKAEELGFKF